MKGCAASRWYNRQPKRRPRTRAWRSSGAGELRQIPLRHGIAHADCVKSYVGLLCTGKSDFDAIENKRNDTFFITALGIERVPSAPSLRQRFDEHAEAMIPHVDAASTDFIATRPRL